MSERLIDKLAKPWGLNTEHPLGLAGIVQNGIGKLPDDLVVGFAPLEHYEGGVAHKAADMRIMIACLCERAFWAILAEAAPKEPVTVRIPRVEPQEHRPSRGVPKEPA